MRYEVKRPRRVATSVAAGFPMQIAEGESLAVPPHPADDEQAPKTPETQRPRAKGRLWREIRRNEARWLFLLVAIGTALALSDRANRPALLWSDVTLAWRDALYLLLPWTGAVAAWTAGRERRHGLDELLAATARSPFRLRLWSWAAVSSMGIVAFLIIGCWLLLISANRASPSHFELGAIVVGLMAIPAFAALGLAWGTWQPRRATPSAVMVGFAFVQTLFGQGDGWAAYLTATPSLARAGTNGVSPDLSTQQFWLFLGLTLVGLALLARVSARGWAIRAALAVGLLVTALAVAGIANHGDEVRAAAHADQTTGSRAPDSHLPVS